MAADEGPSRPRKAAVSAQLVNEAKNKPSTPCSKRVREALEAAASRAMKLAKRSGRRDAPGTC
ncbi:MAG: hypothetical protein MZU97_09580 [Bacillus subtilis]|nr:hypothetical protein [Bacillus subtilis]